MNRYLLLVLLAISSIANAVVIRSDVDDCEYRIPASAFPALADMPGEGHGVLIAPQWVLTAAHAAPMPGMDGTVSIAGIEREVERVIIYPTYTRLPEALVQEALASGNPGKIHQFLAASDDMALIKLAAPVVNVAPVPLYRGNEEVGKIVQLIGKGATGNGADGQLSHGSHRTLLRRAFNAITGAGTRYLWYQFDPPPSGLPLEGILGSGDSGGPVTIGGKGNEQLVGLGSWSKSAPGNGLRLGLYGQVVYNVRVSRYLPWIDCVISAETLADSISAHPSGSCSAWNQPTPVLSHKRRRPNAATGTQPGRGF